MARIILGFVWPAALCTGCGNYIGFSRKDGDPFTWGSLQNRGRVQLGEIQGSLQVKGDPAINEEEVCPSRGQKDLGRGIARRCIPG